ncbi:hypothetical protein IWW38_001675, partial [Coemansia aciculifera]
SVNFALDRWLDVAWDSKHCECVKDSVTIDLMRWFGDVHRERLQKQQRLQKQRLGLEDHNDAKAVRVSPRRHAAAAAASAPTVAAAVAAAAVGGHGRRGRPSTASRLAEVEESHPAVAKLPGSGGGLKRKPSSTAAPSEAVLKSQRQRSAKRALSPAVAVTPAEVSKDVDVSRRYASLHTPVGTCGGCLHAIASIARTVECVQCGLTVHPQCTGLAVDDGTYKCANCVMDTDQLSCALCAFQNGVLLPLQSSPTGARNKKPLPPLFAHLLCATFVPQTFFEFPGVDVDAMRGVPGLVTKEMVAEAKTKPAVVVVVDVPPVAGVGKEKEEAVVGAVSTRSRTAAAAAAATAAPSSSQSFAGPTRHWARVCGVSDALAKESSAGGCCVICCSDSTSEEEEKRVAPLCGAVVGCGEHGCNNMVHPMCAATYRMHPSLLDWTTRKPYCPEHAPPPLSSSL